MTFLEDPCPLISPSNRSPPIFSTTNHDEQASRQSPAMCRLHCVGLVALNVIALPRKCQTNSFVGSVVVRFPVEREMAAPY